MELAGDLLMLIPSNVEVYEFVRALQVVLTIGVALAVVRWGMECIPRMYEAVLLMLFVLAALSITDLHRAIGAEKEDVRSYAWLVYDFLGPGLVLRYLLYRRRFFGKRRLPE
jgi:hypothetical protein